MSGHTEVLSHSWIVLYGLQGQQSYRCTLSQAAKGSAGHMCVPQQQAWGCSAITSCNTRKLCCRQESLYARYGRSEHVKTDTADGRMRNQCELLCVQSSWTGNRKKEGVTWADCHNCEVEGTETCTRHRRVRVCRNGFFCAAHRIHKQNRLLSINMCGFVFSCPRLSFGSRPRERTAHSHIMQT